MSKYVCSICGYIYDEEKENRKMGELGDSWSCPMCGVQKSLFDELVVEKIKKTNTSILVDKNNPAIEKIENKCNNCGACVEACEKLEGIHKKEEKQIICVYCGQCVQACKMDALIPKREAEKLEKAKKEGKVCIAYMAPAVRVAIGEAFGMEYGTFAQGKLVSALKQIGFEYVFDVTFGADLTVMEEASELIKRLDQNQNLPMFTSCCPSWVKYAEIFYPEIMNHLSTCKSPIGMQGQMVKNYFCEKNNLDKNNVYTVAITPCTAKKYEIQKDDGTDLVLTVTEIIEIIKNRKIDFKNLPDSEFDKILGEGSGAGMIFGSTGGVMEATLRTAYYLLTNTDLEKDKIEFKAVRGTKNVREAEIKIKDTTLKVAIIHKMADAKKILEEVKNGTSKYHFIEVMNCEGGCIGGGGQPKLDETKAQELKQKRMQALYQKDKQDQIRCSYQNPEIIALYQDYLRHPLSGKAEALLHRGRFLLSQNDSLGTHLVGR